MKKLNPDSIVAVTGCYAQVNPDEVSAIEGVNIVTGTNEKRGLVDYVEEYAATAMSEKRVERHLKEYEALDIYEETGIITSMESRTRAFIKVQEGCNRFCAYCIIPYARGNVRSRTPEDIIAEAEALLNQGFKELILTGINTALYKAPHGNYGIEFILDKLEELQGDFRIRLSSLEPTVVNAEYVKTLLKYKRLCPHLHLSIQSGSDEILAAMNRKYTRSQYLEIVDVLKMYDKNYAITTDMIVGFPGETDENFNDSLRMIRETAFSKVHVFKYSKRPGTMAAGMKNQVASEVKNRRSAELIFEGERISQQFFISNLNTVRRVLFEEYDNKIKCFTGYTDNYIKVYLPKKELKQGVEGKIENNFHDVRLEQPFKDGILGKQTIR